MISIKFRTLFSGLLLASALMFIGCNSDSGSAESLESNIDSVSYAFGYLNGKQMSQQGMNDLDPEIFSEAMEVAFEEDSSAIPQQEMMGMLQQYQMQAQQKAQQQQAQEGEVNMKKGQEFLAQNESKEGVQTAENGLQYEVLEEGTGVQPDSSDTVRVNYEGTLIDGTVFDSSYERGEPVEFPLNRVIPGWTQGLQLMKEGGKYKFFIPGELAYGQNPPPRGEIGPNETLIFEVQLLKVNPEPDDTTSSSQ